MYWVAFTLGFFGSLHCVGMCGPLAFGMLAHRSKNAMGLLPDVIFYNLGRLVSYSFLGLIIGIVGGVISLGGFQRGLSIFLGVLLLIVAAFSLNLDVLIGKQRHIQSLYKYISSKLQSFVKMGKSVPSIQAGVINGLLPCGLVYVALMAAVTLSNVWGTIGFMTFFGLGTFPAMIVVVLLPKFLNIKYRLVLQKLYPFFIGLTGIYLIYRGIMSKLPMQLNFIDALHHPIMCH